MHKCLSNQLKRLDFALYEGTARRVNQARELSCLVRTKGFCSRLYRWLGPASN